MNSLLQIPKTASRQKLAHCTIASGTNRPETRAASRVWARRRVKLASGESLYNYFRDYDPSTGRYVQSDPIGLRGGMNYFEYGLSTPIRRFDVFGLCSFMGWVQVTTGSEFKNENADKLVMKIKVIKPMYDDAACSFSALFPLLPGMPFNPRLPPCLPKFETEIWDWWKRAFRQFSRVYEDGYYLYVCPPEDCLDDGIRKQWARRYLSSWKLDFERVTNRFDFVLRSRGKESSGDEF